MTIHKVYGRFLEHLCIGRINVQAHSIKGMLCEAGYSPNQNTHGFKSDINHEITGSGYAPGGQVITGINATYNGSTKLLSLSAGPMNWPVVTFSAARYLVVYDDSWPDQTNKPLLMYVDFETPQSPVSKSFYYNWPGGVMMKLALP